jgi:DnaJ-class molecular chaperone
MGEKCQTCQGKGSVRYVYPSNKPQPCYWFKPNAHTCPDCGGTGEAP